MIEISNLSYHYPENDKLVIDHMNLTINKGEFACIIGHSGCGKSTLITLLSGLTKSTSGKITIDGVETNSPGTNRAIVFQQYSLFPWMTVYMNVLFAVKKTKKFDARDSQERTIHFLKKVGMYEERNKYPFQLSGGMRQRTAIARALAMDSEILLLDEPFGALDYQIRKELQNLLKKLWSEDKKTIIFVTHDLDEALMLGERILFLKEGKIQKEMAVNQNPNDFTMLRTELEEWYQ